MLSTLISCLKSEDSNVRKVIFLNFLLFCTFDVKYIVAAVVVLRCGFAAVVANLSIVERELIREQIRMNQIFPEYKVRVN